MANYIKQMARGCCSCLNSTSILPDQGFTADKNTAKVGWIAYNDNGNTLYYDPESPNVGSLTEANIIGIVVIPASHTQDGTVRVVSLDYMNYTTPTTGSTTAQSMYWGGYGSEVPNLTSVDKIVTYVTGTTTTALDSSAKFPSNYDLSFYSTQSDIAVSDNDNNRKFIAKFPWGSAATATPSPYNTDGSTNYDYFNTSGSILSQGLCGAENTDKIMADVTHSGDILNLSGNGYHPAAECCRAYKDGSWYLPSEAELGYLCANLKEIEYTRNVLGRDSFTAKYYWSSSLCSSNDAWRLDLGLGRSFGYCDSNGKNSDDSVLAFVAL